MPLIQPTFNSTPSNLNASFQRPKYPDPQPTFLTAILSFYPPKTSICFGCQRSIREGNDLFSITKSRRPVGRDNNGITQYNTSSKNVYFHLWEDCVRSVFRILLHDISVYIKLIMNYFCGNKAIPCYH